MRLQFTNGALISNGYIKNGGWENRLNEFPILDIDYCRVRHSKLWKEFRLMFYSKNDKYEIPLATNNLNKAYDNFWELLRYVLNSYIDMFCVVNNELCINLTTIKQIMPNETDGGITLHFGNDSLLNIDKEFSHHVIKEYTNYHKMIKGLKLSEKQQKNEVEYNA